MAFNNLPMLWVFSLRNNCLMWLTGWSFATFMTFHRHISRIVLIQAIVHASTYSAYQAAFDYLAASWNEHYWQMGAMAIIAMGFIHLASSIYFRIKCYELFLVAHIALSVVFLAGLFYHIDHFVGRYDAYIWPLVGVWAFDRAVRIARLAYCNIALFSSGTVVGYNSVASLLGETGLIKLEVTISSQFPTLGAGQHFYLYRPLKWRGWESHPFTLAGWTWTHTETSANEVEQSESLRDLPEKKAARTDTIATLPPSADAGISLPIPANTPKHDEGSKSTILTTEMEQVSGRKVTFYIRPRGGWTMRLRDECLKEPSRSVRGLTLLEGPYGQVRSPIHTFENVVFVVGGSGITVAMSYLQDHVERTTRPPRRGRTMRTRTRQITLVWVTRKTSMIREITSGGGQLRRVCHRGDVRMRLFATSPRVEEQDEAEVEAEAEPHTLDKGSAGHEKADDQGRQRRQPQLHILHGRPSITDEVFSAINGAASLPQDARTAIVACGPAGIADETRAAVHKVLKEGNDRVEYFEEKFGYVQKIDRLRPEVAIPSV
ncbi:hypothetical protein PV08_03319 [Exophiala spinifera]|uniref:FAD-binding FR-type domain-containing protein n=1 Tax=Exophiala spinifera TaxID=91928 RepID=A0A0D2C681_9EURO|nr:uncharacterized protein PV08_03319 [Exophiala spinifera]KIW19029.1 hypothetical protein PV08_03319 [Exophiala spinifera]